MNTGMHCIVFNASQVLIVQTNSSMSQPLVWSSNIKWGPDNSIFLCLDCNIYWQSLILICFNYLYCRAWLKTLGKSELLGETVTFFKERLGCPLPLFLQSVASGICNVECALLNCVVLVQCYICKSANDLYPSNQE